MFKKILKRNDFYVFIVLIVITAVFTLINPRFIHFENIFDITKFGSLTAILALGVFTVLLTGGLDVSFAAIAISGQYIAVKTIIATGIDNIFFAFLISCLVGICLGAINGLLIANFKLPALITTLGTMGIFHGTLLTVVGSELIFSSNMPKSIVRLGQLTIINVARDDGSKYGLSVFILIVIFLAIATWLLLKYTIIGRGIYAIGSNMDAAIRGGFNVKKITILVYCYAGFLYGIMGIMHSAMLKVSTPTNIVGDELIIIAAVVLGGARIIGGSGTVLGTMLGTAIITILYTSLILINLSSFWNQFFIGMVILISIIITSYQKRRKIS